MAIEKRAASGGASLGWSVGRFEWLNNPNSKVNRYWRTIEYGSTETDWPWVGKKVVGLWGPDAGSNDRPNKLIQGDLSAFGNRRDQKFVPFFKTIGDDDEAMARAGRSALYYFLGAGKGPNMELLNSDPSAGSVKGGRGKSVERARKRFYYWLMTRATFEQMPFVSGIIMRQVLAGDYYDRALRSFDPMRREVEALEDVLGFGAATSKGRTQLRKMQGLDSPGDPKPKKGPPRGDSRSLKALQGGLFLTTVDASVQVQDNVRNSRGQFTSGQGAVAEINRRMAIAFQEEVVALMQYERRRPATGDLIAATRDPKNRLPQ